MNGKRAAMAFLVTGILLAAAAFALVAGAMQRAQEAALRTVPQVSVVMVTQPIPEHTAVRPDAVALKPFPAAYLPNGAATRLEDVVGKFTTVPLVGDQVVLSAQLSATRRATNLSGLIPEGKVAFWMPLPELLALSGGLRPGDRVDILLSLSVAGGAASTASVPAGDRRAADRGLVTQTTLQGAEVFFTGSAANVDLGGTRPAGNGRVVVFLLDPQDALLAKYVKDSGGTIDLVLRPAGAHERYETAPVGAETVLDLFRFRVPAAAPAAPASPAVPTAEGAASSGREGA